MICRITDGFLSFSAEIKKFIGDWGKVFGQNMKDMEKEDSECHNFTRKQTHKSSRPDNKIARTNIQERKREKSNSNAHRLMLVFIIVFEFLLPYIFLHQKFKLNC